MPQKTKKSEEIVGFFRQPLHFLEKHWAGKWNQLPNKGPQGRSILKKLKS